MELETSRNSPHAVCQQRGCESVTGEAGVLPAVEAELDGATAVDQSAAGQSIGPGHASSGLGAPIG